MINDIDLTSFLGWQTSIWDEHFLIFSSFHRIFSFLPQNEAKTEQRRGKYCKKTETKDFDQQ